MNDQFAQQHSSQDIQTSKAKVRFILMDFLIWVTIKRNRNKASKIPRQAPAILYVVVFNVSIKALSSICEK